jgi:hypothetical protein
MRGVVYSKSREILLKQWEESGRGRAAARTQAIEQSNGVRAEQNAGGLSTKKKLLELENRQLSLS